MSALWIFATIHGATHCKPVPVHYTPSHHELILKADVPAHHGQSADDVGIQYVADAPPVVSEIVIDRAVEICVLRKPPIVQDNYQLIRTGLSPPSAAALA